MKKTVFILFLILSMVCLSNYGCKKSDTGTFVLTVIKDDNVDGFPEAGTYIHDMNSQVPYNYSVNRLHTNPNAVLDDIEIPLQGTITMDRDHTLTIGCDRIDFSGKWTVDYVWAYFGCSLPDVGNAEEITIVQTGDSLTITLLSDTITLEGNVYDNGLFSASFEGEVVNFVASGYSVSGQFQSPDRLEGELVVNRYRSGWNWQNYYTSSHLCESKALFAGIKK